MDIIGRWKCLYDKWRRDPPWLWRAYANCDDKDQQGKWELSDSHQQKAHRHRPPLCAPGRVVPETMASSGPWARKRFTPLIDSRLEQITRKFENRGRWTRLEIVVQGVARGMPGGKIWPGLHSASCLPDMSCSIFQPPSWTETRSKVNCFSLEFLTVAVLS